MQRDQDDDRSFVEKQRAAHRELGLLLRRRPVEDPEWRLFWKAWIPPFLLTFAVIEVWDLALVPWGLLVIAALSLVSGLVVRRLRVRAEGLEPPQP